MPRYKQVKIRTTISFKPTDEIIEYAITLLEVGYFVRMPTPVHLETDAHEEYCRQAFPELYYEKDQIDIGCDKYHGLI